MAGHAEKTYEDYGEYQCKVITEYDSAGNKIKETCYNSDGTVCDIYEYYSNGKDKKHTEYKSDGSWFVTEYDSHANEIKETVYNSDGSVVDGYICDYEYNSNGKVVKFTKYDSNGAELMHYEAASGNYIVVLIYSVYDVYIWESDSTGEDVKKAYYTPTGSADYIANFAGPNYPLDFTKFNSDGSVNYTYRYEYEYNSENKPSKITEKKDGAELMHYEAASGNYIEVRIDSLHGWVETVDEYDSDGYWIKRTEYNPDGTINTNPD